MSNPNWLVVEDPTGEWWEGALVEESRKAQLEARGVVLLPVLPDLFRRSGVGGFHKRAWGAGWPVLPARPTIVAPLTLYCSASFAFVHWAARVMPSSEQYERIENSEKGVIQGFLRFIADASQAIPNKAGCQPVVECDLSTLDNRTVQERGFIVRGSAKVSIPGDGHYGFALYGAAAGLRVVWAAASQSAE